ncbi:Bifunctional heparan sulfate N-deacetylase/N-sulfotransferase [Halotydeus destructor]|nr:Bifunctional heparan sulfate N-deacetylase/N-sulfotransferase [Halotydeus destructor]
MMMAAALTMAMVFLFSYYLSTTSTYHGLTRVPPQPHFRCHSRSKEENGLHLLTNPPTVAVNHASNARLRLDPKVLVFVETQYSKLGKQIHEVLEASRIKFKVEISGKSLPLLTNLDKGKFAVIIFENLEKYLNMNKWNRELLDKYCREYRVGIVGFLPPHEEHMTGVPLKGFPVEYDANVPLQDYHLNPSSPVLRITRAGEVHDGLLSGREWLIFRSNHSSYRPLAQAYVEVENTEAGYDALDRHVEFNKTEQTLKNVTRKKVMTVVQDFGLFDGIQRVMFGSGLDFWLHKLLILDAISYLSHGKLSLPLDRYLLIDIDDIFVGEKGTRMKPVDVESLIAAQEKFMHLVPGFRFNLGFSGKYYHKGTPEENAGDDFLISNSHKFWWFCHMWSHSQPHLHNMTILEQEMLMNKEFAQKNKIPIDSGYSIAPHHSGVYPVHEPLYEAWKRIWNVRVTSTEEYPHLRPARLRRAFIHRGIMVLPRQTCGLYTHTIFIDKYPGGQAKLENSILGGELFYTFIFNPINIFMTHLSNYGNDRLALYAFESVIKFVQCWTNLRISTLPPTELAAKYFQMHPEESDPLWVNPCLDKRHFAIWSLNKSCDQLPKALVVGPQKTGTTALYSFMLMHPEMQSNHASPETFEEVQFFSGKNYYKGLDWYMSFFPVPSNASLSKITFEKSATYFDGELVPLRAHSLLPNAKIIVILISPIKRAYSWYQHMRAHRDVTALNYTFHDVIAANEKSPKALRELRNRCLNPGIYSQHLEHWLSFYSPQQLMIVDGDELKSDPVSVMSRLQVFLKVETVIEYQELLRFDVKKGFYCPITDTNSTKCLGKGKGRIYEEMEPRAEKFLRSFYMSHNVALSKLMSKLHHPTPAWLEDDLSQI